MAIQLVMCAPVASFRNFYYLLSRASPIFINLFFYILYFTLYYLLFVNCSLLVFFSPVCLCEKVWYGVYIVLFFSCFFVTAVYITESHYNSSLFFTFLGRVVMQGIECGLLLLM